MYIYDYLVKKKLHATAKSFMTEGKVAPDPVGNNTSSKLVVKFFVFSFLPVTAELITELGLAWF